MDPNWEEMAPPVKLLVWAICTAASLALLAGAAYLFRAVWI